MPHLPRRKPESGPYPARRDLSRWISPSGGSKGKAKAWISERYPNETDVDLVSANADPDRNGISNLLEFALSDSAGGVNRENMPQVEDFPESGLLTLRYYRPKDRPSLSYEIQVSSAVGGEWTILTPPQLVERVTSVSATMEEVEIDIVYQPATTIFVRLIVTESVIP